MAQPLKVLAFLGENLNSQNPHRVLLTAVTPALGDLMPSSGLLGRIEHTLTQIDKHTYQ